MCKGFRSVGNKGFHITYENNVTVSVQFGKDNYCENRRAEINYPMGQFDSVECEDAEVAVWVGGYTDYITNEFEDSSDAVLPACSPKKVLEIMKWAEAYIVKKGE